MDKQEYFDMYDVEERHWWFKGKRRVYSSVLEKIFKSRRDLNILDFGCGTGRNILTLGKYGRVTGVDISQDSYNLCAKRGIDIKLLDIFKKDAEALKGKYDLITCFDVLEHLEDDGKTIRRLGEFLASGGYILATVPAHQFLWSDHDAILHHKRRYNKKNLRDAFEKNKFEVILISYYNSFIFPMAILRRILNLKKTSTAMTDIAILNRAILPFYDLESRLVPTGMLPFGVSLICLAGKKDK
jgi:SAM-dependent methyltransferase